MKVNLTSVLAVESPIPIGEVKICILWLFVIYTVYPLYLYNVFSSLNKKV